MTKRLVYLTLATFLFAGLGLAGEKAKSGEKTKAEKGTWQGWVTDTHCGAEGAKKGHADCARSCVKNRSSKYALYISADGEVYVLEPQQEAEEYAGEQVKVQGTMEGDTLRISLIEEAEEEENQSERNRLEERKE
jgi:hypothetical protein